MVGARRRQPRLDRLAISGEAASSLSLHTQLGSEPDGRGAPPRPRWRSLHTSKRVLLVDHQDSFVHTLANYLRQTGADVTTLRAVFPLAELDRLRPDLSLPRATTSSWRSSTGIFRSPSILTLDDDVGLRLLRNVVERLARRPLIPA